MSPPPEYIKVFAAVVVPSLIPFPVALMANPSGMPSEATPPLLPSSRPPAKTMFPPPANPLVVDPFAVLMVALSPRVMAPLLFASASDQKITSPPLVVIVLFALCTISPLDFNKMSPFTFPEVVLMLPSTVIFPPYAVIGPEMEIAPPKVISCVLVDLPSVNPVAVLLTLTPPLIGKVKAFMKELPEDSIVTAPVVLNSELFTKDNLSAFKVTLLKDAESNPFPILAPLM